MRKQSLILLVFALYAVMAGASQAQTNPAPAAVAYSLLAGSTLLNDCPICDHVPLPMPMTGTFQLLFKEANPLYGSYELLDISFQAGPSGVTQYTVTGSGTYHFGGPGSIIQDAFLDVTIDDGAKKTECYCQNTVPGTGTVWPQLVIDVDQTNGTPSQVYRLHIVAAPVPQFTSIIPERPAGDVRLSWVANGQPVQLERSASVNGTFMALTAATTNQTYIDPGVLTNHASYYYRLRW